MCTVPSVLHAWLGSDRSYNHCLLNNLGCATLLWVLGVIDATQNVMLCCLVQRVSESKLLVWKQLSIWLQDASFDPYAFAKVATRTASSEAGSAAACPRNVQSFFKELFALSNNSTGVELINQHMKLCSDSKLKSAQDTSGLASFLGELWVIGVSCTFPF